MTKVLLLFFMTISVFAQSRFIELTISPWISKCENLNQNCQPARAYGEKIVVRTEILETFEPGSAQVSRTPFANSTQSISGLIKNFSIFPHPSSPYPPYVQFQVTLKKPMYLMCSHSISVRNLEEVPPIICSSTYNNDRLGLTITFGKLQEL